MAVQTGYSKVNIKTTKGQYSSVWLEPVMLVSRLLNDSWKINVYFSDLSYTLKHIDSQVPMSIQLSPESESLKVTKPTAE